MRIKTFGFTLVEVLVAMLILSISLLGMAGLQVLSLQSSSGSLSRSQATMLSYDLVERIRRNADEVDDYIALVGNFPALPTSPDCLTSGCSSEELVQEDIIQWNTELSSMIPGAQTTLIEDSGTDDKYTLAISWQESQYGNVNNEPLSYTMTFEL
ncbi:type IV pilus modification protein PilV [Endozoicomonas sp.]|uniref:type IV pilus modification protein PilV n=1 Tax=Endozoicomonas sp. TaxID=1892382 RepID=UPI0028887668|nr:type IV pilus modification protein PilV [Endozoicomonas sp.]